jgi:hypothetical protein
MVAVSGILAGCRYDAGHSPIPNINECVTDTNISIPG